MAVILFILILLVLIVGHELGHFTVAKSVGMKVLEFGVGFPPKLWGKKFGETEYSVNAIPFGGFVRIFGEDETERFEERAFARHSKWAQLATLFAGPGMNIVLGFLAFWIALMVGIPIAIDPSTPANEVKNAHVIVTDILPNSPAAESGLQKGDKVISVGRGDEAVPVTKSEDIPVAIGTSVEPLTIVVSRADGEHTLYATPKVGLLPDEPTKLAIGIASVLLGTQVLSPGAALIEAGKQTVVGLWQVVTGLVGLIGSALTFSASLGDVSGPVGIAGLVGDAATLGAGQVLLLAAVISLNLAIINLLPFPALDGGRIVMLAIETLRGRPIPQQTAAYINAAGFAVLLLLMVVVTWNDIAKLLG
jgi:regulator of sigma E protease